MCSTGALWERCEIMPRVLHLWSLVSTDFLPGEVGFDEEDSGNETHRVEHGVLPDRNNGYPDVALRFCCRHDGILNAELPLPVTHPFYLFPFYNMACPDVTNMTSVREFTYFDCEDFFNQNYVTGTTPLSYIFGNLRIEFCYYYQ